MALTRRALKAMGVDEDKIEEIISLHTETVDGLKAEIEKYKQNADETENLQKELEEAKADMEAEKKKDWRSKYESVKDEFEDYKTEVEHKQTHEAKKSAYRDLLREAGVSDKRISSVLKVSDVDEIELDDKGKVKGSDKLVNSIKSEWSDFIVSDSTQGAKTATPPANEQGKGQRTGRAARISAQYHDSLYGKVVNNNSSSSNAGGGKGE